MNWILSSPFPYFKQRLRLNFKVVLLLETFNKSEKIKRDFKIFNLERYLNYNIHAIILERYFTSQILLKWNLVIALYDLISYYNKLIAYLVISHFNGIGVSPIHFGLKNI
jgi:hypothetical protein